MTMPDVRNTALGRLVTADCGCGWSLWRRQGFTKRQAYQAVSQHRRADCPDPIYALWREER